MDRGLPDGPFSGVPFLVKDLGVEVAGLPATRGSRLFADAIAAQDSPLVARYRQAGLVVLGTTNTPEFGKNASTEPLLHGPTRNPWRTTHSPGGSSGGSAAAVASGMVACRARQRRRRLDPHPVLDVRPVRFQAVARQGPGRVDR